MWPFLDETGQIRKPYLTCGNSGAPGAIRTRDTRFRRAVLCPLSYEGINGICKPPLYAFWPLAHPVNHSVESVSVSVESESVSVSVSVLVSGSTVTSTALNVTLMVTSLWMLL